MLLYQQAFGQAFELGIDVPECFKDRSYKNDVCPCFVYPSTDGRTWVLWIDYEESQERELVGCSRYTLECHVHSEHPCRVLETDSPERIADLLSTIVG